MAVGQRVYVDAAGHPSGSIPLGDVNGKVFSNVQLPDGVEVEVIAWRPGGADDTRYRVRTAHGIDGWLPAANLRRSAEPAPRASAPTPAAAMPSITDTGVRPFGQRVHGEPSAAAPSLASPQPFAPGRSSSAADTGGRRFGQR
jgi:hypothetical protein